MTRRVAPPLAPVFRGPSTQWDEEHRHHPGHEHAHTRTPIVCDDYATKTVHARRDWSKLYYVAGVRTTTLCGTHTVCHDQPTCTLDAVTCRACVKALNTPTSKKGTA